MKYIIQLAGIIYACLLLAIGLGLGLAIAWFAQWLIAATLGG